MKKTNRMTKDKLPSVLVRLQVCKLCGKELALPALTYAENPFCRDCVTERQNKAATSTRRLGWKGIGNYLILTDLAGQTPQ
jgi:uncharacterized paraquat-inducible protein A